MISAIVLTKNEEKQLPACLASLKWVDELIVIDSKSQDQTVAIAKKFGAQVYEREFDNYVNQKNWAAEKATGDWVLYLDADERVLASLRSEIAEITKSADYSAYAISRRNIILGQEEKYGPFWPDWVIRLVKREDFKKWVGEVHEHMEFSGNLGYTKNSLLHLTHRNVDQIIAKNLLWSKIDAQLRLDAHHPPMSGWRFLRILVTELWNQGILRRGFFSGTVGVVDALLQTFSLLTTYVRLWEMQQPKPLGEVYTEIDQKLLDCDFKYS